MNTAIKQFKVSKLDVLIYSNRVTMGQAASDKAAQVLREAVQRQGQARIIVASAPSQNELIAGLAESSGIDWSRVTIFHMDEYIGMAASHRASFRNYQRRHLLANVQPAAFHGIRGEAANPEAECARYAALLAAAPIDLVCMGIGENGHIAFNDPPVADFNDPRSVKVVELDETCRRQQVNDGCFPNLDVVPRRAITLTCPTLMSGRALICVVPDSRKAEAVSNTLRAQICTACPATILRLHTNATLYLDLQSVALLPSHL